MWSTYVPEQCPITFSSLMSFRLPMTLFLFLVLYLESAPITWEGLTCSMTFTGKMVLAIFGVSHALDLIILWMTKSLMDDIHGWGVLFDDKVGDGTVSVADVVFKEFA
ncbi:Mitochondrial fission protein ELM1 [Zea mays]|uniref:Mitochondrial fission protein ELM1 n=1 Tax=Zea mays TaxID=4577 RepID=A0A1D6FRB7_MAIZE|nr:Mitochondrial fission protein ELM1 [Zea mays]